MESKNTFQNYWIYGIYESCDLPPWKLSKFLEFLKSLIILHIPLPPAFLKFMEFINPLEGRLRTPGDAWETPGDASDTPGDAWGRLGDVSFLVMRSGPQGPQGTLEHV